MAVFKLDTDRVSSVSSSLQSIASQIRNIASSVSGYDTSCDEFDFSSPKSVIASNIEACATKVSNTSTYLERVASRHSALQNSLKFGVLGSTDSDGHGIGTSTSGGAGSRSAGRSGGGYSGGYASSYSGGGGGGYSTYSGPTKSAPVDIAIPSNGIQHGTAQTGGLSEVGKTLFESKALAYNTAGYATIGGMFLIACSSQYGKVGDELTFTLDDGQTFRCIIAKVDDSTNGKIHFFVNDEWKANNPDNFQEDICDHIVKAQNLGQNTTYTCGATISGALEWAETIANDDRYGYSQSTRWGNPNYDCSSFVISAYEAAGIPVKEAGASYTGNMIDAFVQCGFEWIPGNPNVNTLKPGDIVLDVDAHTEMYFGNGKLVGAHSNKDGRDGDSSGNEINISNYYSHPWDGVLRYVGSGQNDAKAVAAPNAPKVSSQKKSTDVEVLQV